MRQRKGKEWTELEIQKEKADFTQKPSHLPVYPLYQLS